MRSSMLLVSLDDPEEDRKSKKSLSEKHQLELCKAGAPLTANITEA